MSGAVLGLLVAIVGIACVVVGFVRRYTEDRDVLVLLYVGGLCLALAGTVSLM